MRLVVLDYRGTLDRHPNPLALVRALRARGDRVVIWSGDLSAVPLLILAAASADASKHRTIRELVDDEGGASAFDEVLVADDDPWICETVVDCGWRCVEPNRLDVLLGDVR